MQVINQVWIKVLISVYRCQICVCEKDNGIIHTKMQLKLSSLTTFHSKMKNVLKLFDWKHVCYYSSKHIQIRIAKA